MKKLSAKTLFGLLVIALVANLSAETWQGVCGDKSLHINTTKKKCCLHLKSDNGKFSPVACGIATMKSATDWTCSFGLKSTLGLESHDKSFYVLRESDPRAFYCKGNVVMKVSP
jgi:hypothetical protein